jgi:phosphoglycolate phosphatase-like HAD superfamily hydrolase
LSPAKQEKEQTETIIVDFDFTLADSSEGIVECVRCAPQELGFRSTLPMLNREAIRRLINVLQTSSVFRVQTDQ